MKKGLFGLIFVFVLILVVSLTVLASSYNESMREYDNQFTVIDTNGNVIPYSNVQITLSKTCETLGSMPYTRVDIFDEVSGFTTTHKVGFDITLFDSFEITTSTEDGTVLDKIYIQFRGHTSNNQ